MLIQDGRRTAEADMTNTEELYELLNQFFAYEQTSIRDFRKAIAKFGEDLPAILDALRERIREKREASPDFAKAEETFLKQVKETINPSLERADVTEMLIQHILTEDIFNRVFDMRDYHRDNNIAKQLYALERKLFEYGDKRSLLQALRPYYTGIEETAHLIQSHSEKQNFLKSLYENFYKVYNPKAADRLGVVYTPGEIVRFMIRSADWLCEKHFGKNLVDRGVEILDPATGTGTYIVELLEYFRGQPDKLRQKYKEELHANEVAILPYYVANLNIEATYQAITGQFAEFEGLCLVDTLDNVDGLGIHSGHQFDMLGALSDENIERVKRQNRRKISIIIGNPPYNANQQSENDNNKNREYPHIDDRIKRTYIKESTAQKTKLYDMYSRFYRWASDRLGDEGIVAFVNNNSFLEARTFDGFRKRMAEEFSEAWVIDLKGNARNSGERRRREGGNVFEDKIKVGVAVAFFIRKKSKAPFRINYLAVEDYATEDDKRSYIASRDLQTDKFVRIRPNERSTWLNQIEASEWDEFLPIADKAVKSADDKRKERAIFKLFSLGVKTNRDDWAVSRSSGFLDTVYEYHLQEYRDLVRSLPKGKLDYRKLNFNDQIKWTRKTRKLAAARSKLVGKPNSIQSLYRPYDRQRTNFLWQFNEDHYQLARLERDNTFSRSILISGQPASKPFQALAVIQLWHHDTLEKATGLSSHRYTKSGEQIDNITDWALNKFKAHYKDEVAAARHANRVGNGGVAHQITNPDGSVETLELDASPPAWPADDNGVPTVTKDAIFAYCYAVLHDPVYREKYALNLKREFPRIPFYPDFAQWVEWGEALLDLHIDYEEVEPYPLERVDTPNPKRAEGSHPKPKLKSFLAEGAETGSVVVDEDTQITGIPAGAWDYRLGNRSAIDWVLDQHKEKKPRDPTIREKFNTYRFADYKESMIDLLAKVVRVSVETNAITDVMAALDRSDWGDSSP
ncbi:type ISP restriction/modification enzyme [Altererythrobacter sp. MTPC7]|uniref:type ISP restriction/modification enzyme n=1 Tax=Altererythrobacter sp. MTPC7 TaxID=3056567 RepID=UPI0036F388E8